MVSQVPLDYMHLFCLGVTKKLVLLWLEGRNVWRLRALEISRLSKALHDSRVWIPMEFARKPRSLDEVHRWKALEFRLLLLYLGPVILSDFLSPEIVKHFNCLHCATRILCDPKDCIKNNPYAKELLVCFVDQFKILYGEATMIHNIHNSIHISNDVLLYKNLDAFSAFPFENWLEKEQTC